LLNGVDTSIGIGVGIGIGSIGIGSIGSRWGVETTIVIRTGSVDRRL
jgi:hypothetical protein